MAIQFFTFHHLQAIDFSEQKTMDYKRPQIDSVISKTVDRNRAKKSGTEHATIAQQETPVLLAEVFRFSV